MYDNIKARLNMSIYFNLGKEIFNPQLNATDLLEAMLAEGTTGVAEVLMDNVGTSMSSACEQKSKMTLHQIIDYVNMPMNALQCGFIDANSKWNSIYRSIEVKYGSLKSVYGDDAYFGFYCDLSFRNGEYQLNAYDDVVKLGEFGDIYIPSGKPKLWTFNSPSAIKNIGLNIMANILPLGVGAPYSLRKRIDATAIYVDAWSWCSMISIGMVEKMHRLFEKIDSVPDETWAVYHAELTANFAKELKRLLMFYLPVFGYKVTMIKSTPLTIPTSKVIKPRLISVLANRLSKLADIKSSLTLGEIK